MFFTLLLLLAVSAEAKSPAEAPEGCRSVATYQHEGSPFGVKGKALEDCTLLVKSLAIADARVRALTDTAARVVPAAPAGEQESQEQLFGRIAGQARVSGEQKGRLAREARTLSGMYLKAQRRAEKALVRFDKESFAVLQDAERAHQPQIKVLHGRAKEELTALRDAAAARSSEQHRSSLALRDDANELWRTARASDERAARLRAPPAAEGDTESEDEPSPADQGKAPPQDLERSAAPQEQPREKRQGGISDNTLFALGGAALIAGGTVAGLYFVADSTLDKANALAYQRIIQAENAAHGVIRNAEETASRILQLARDSVKGVLTDIEETGKRIAERAKKDVESLIRQLEAELRLAFGNLTKEGVEKLRTELRGMFEQEILRAEANGDTALAGKLRKALGSLDPIFAEELAKRAKAAGTGTSTNTGTSTSTATGTATGTAP